MRTFKHTLNIDLETFSFDDIKLGVTKYSTTSEILLFGYSFNRKPVEIVDIANFEDVPGWIEEALWDEKVLKKAWNAAFEIEQIEKFYGRPLDLTQWQCTMVKSARCGYPLKLEKAPSAMGLNIAKDTEGIKLIKLFSVPQKPSKANPATRVYPWDAPEQWEKFKQYCMRDVEVEMVIDEFLSKYPDTTEFEKKMYVLDRQINKRGVGLDLPFIDKVIELDAKHKDRLLEQAKELTGLENPNSVSQLIPWLESRTGILWKGLDKDILKFAIDKGVAPLVESVTYEKGSAGYAKIMSSKVNINKYSKPDAVIPDSFTVKEVRDKTITFNKTKEVSEMLELRRELSNTSVAKYVKMRDANVGGRIYDTIQFNGAGRTGRNAGRLIQPQNLPRITMDTDEKNNELYTARCIARDCDLDILSLCYDSPSNVLSQLIRTALYAKPGYIFKVADLSAIEARVLAWLAGEEHVLEVFRTHGKIYEATAAMMFKVPIESIDKRTPKGAEMRQRGKTASLACGYQGAVNAITKMDQDRKIPDDVKPGLVRAWREAHPNIVRFWYKTQDCAIKAIKNPGEKVPLAKGAYFVMCHGSLLFYLPSGRYLAYPYASLVDGKYGPQVKFKGIDQTTGFWSSQVTYGGSLVENLVQAVARDILMCGMYNVVRAGYDIVFSVHDEIVTEMPENKGSLKEIEELMCKMPSWADGLPLAAEGFESKYYKK